MFMKWLMANSLLHKSKARGFLVFALIVVLTTSCALLPDESVEEELPIITPPILSQKPEYEVRRDTIESKVSGVGKLMSTNEEDVYFIEANKRIQKIHVSLGDHVSEGQLIAELDVTDLKNQLRQRELQFRSDELQMIQTLRRANELSAEELEQAKIAFELKRTDLVELKESIDRSKVFAPITGHVVSLSMKEGDMSQAYETVAVIADLTHLAVAAKLSTNDLAKIAIGMETLVNINSVGNFTGRVKQLPMEGSNNNNNPWGPPPRETIDNFVVVELDSPPANLNRGTPLSINVIVNRKEDVVVIPPAALRTHVGRNYVQVVDEEGNKREVDVEVGQQTATLVEIVKGLEPGQKVVGR